MGVINRTTLATSQPVNLTRGFPIFPANTSLDNPRQPVIIGIGAAPSISQSLINSNVPLAIWRFRASVTGNLIAAAFFGFNLQYTVEGQTGPNGTADVAFTGDSSQGGAGFGFGFTLSFSLSLEQSRITWTWRNGFRTTWERVFNTSASATIDLIRITLQLLRAAGVNVPLEQLDTVRDTAGSGAIWGLFDSASNQLASRGSLTLRPRVSVSGNILQLIPAVRGVLTTLKKAGAKLSVGPQLNIVFPITIDIVRLTTEDGNYTLVDNSGSTFFFLGGPRIAANAPPVRQISVTHRHSVGLEFRLAISGKVSLWSIFSFSAAVPIELGAVLPVTPLGTGQLFGPFFTQLSNPPATAMAELPEVTWG